MVAREGIEDLRYPVESEDILEDPGKVTPNLNPLKVWLLADVLGRKFGARLKDGLEGELVQVNLVSSPHSGTR
jgi:hypothetical protein